MYIANAHLKNNDAILFLVVHRDIISNDEHMKILLLMYITMYNLVIHYNVHVHQNFIMNIANKHLKIMVYILFIIHRQWDVFYNLVIHYNAHW